jgi:DNA-binding response OmpR family regulator
MDQTATVLVVDDEEDIVALMRDFLEADGYRVLTAADGHEALASLDDDHVDCVLLDIMMPGISGFDVLRRIRETSNVPVLFLSAKQEDSDKIRGLGLGGDDYIVKSATPGEIVARVRAVLRRTQRDDVAASPTLDFGRLAVDPRAREVRVDGALVSLTAREFDLLLLLAEHPRQVLTRDTIFERLWGPYGDRHSLTVHIGRLREKIERDPADPEYIVTVWGVGYRFEGERR